MKKVVQFILGLILIHPFNIQAQFRYGFGDSLFVWAATLNLREDADAEAFIKEKIPYGTAVTKKGMKNGSNTQTCTLKSRST
jgi:hypothetical protein